MANLNDTRVKHVDPNSNANFDEVKVKHLSLNLNVDFDRQVLDGCVTLTLASVGQFCVRRILLDTKDLSIHKIVDAENNRPLEFSLKERAKFGSCLDVSLSDFKDGMKICVYYTTAVNGGASALQWLNAAQTAGKTHPYMFSQCQAIHCRSMIPCQDTPAVKATYSAEISAPFDLTVLMSAVSSKESVAASPLRRVHYFLQEIPIQSYLIAIVVGLLESRSIGPRSHIWSEKEYVDKAAFEFSQTEEMLSQAEKLCGPYVWGIYDILVLPPSFPYGGMENPCLTFVTPTVLTGDKNFADVVCHEIAHSWTGNLVTNINFEHFWLNEGFTVFLERKILGRMYGEPRRALSGICGWHSLEDGINHLGSDNPLTSLVVKLDGVDPDDAFSIVPYEKGSVFLLFLEEKVGGAAKFEPFFRSYIDEFKHLSINSDTFKNYFMKYFSAEGYQIDWKQWFENPGMPSYKPQFDQSLFDACIALSQRWFRWVSADEEPCPFDSHDLDSFIAPQIVLFLTQFIIPGGAFIGGKILRKMDELYKFSSSQNMEIKFFWIRLGLAARLDEAVDQAVQMLEAQGRMKFVRPLYRDLYAWEEIGRPIAFKTFNENKQFMMEVAVKGVEADLKLR